MDDDNLISPVGGSRPALKNRRPVPANQDRKKRLPQQRPADHKPEQDDDDQHSIDEYA